MTKISVLCVLGTTASGKSELIGRIAERMPVSLVSVDSSQVYRGFDIGTAKPSAQEQTRFAHRLIDIRNPDEDFTAGDFCNLATKEIEQTRKNDIVPILSGGTLFYLDALFQRLPQLPRGDQRLRQWLCRFAEEKGNAYLARALFKLDERSAAAIHINDRQRLIRALEIILQLGKAIPQRTAHPLIRPIYCCIGFDDVLKIKSRIQRRLLQMFKDGFIEEVEGLIARWGYDPHRSSWSAIGYSEIAGYLHGRTKRESMIQSIITRSCQLAKKQRCWIRAKQPIWLDIGDINHQCDQMLKVMTQLDTLKVRLQLKKDSI